MLDEDGEDIDISGLYEDDTPAFVQNDYPAPAHDEADGEDVSDEGEESDEEFDEDFDDDFVDEFLADDEDEISDIFAEEAVAAASVADDQDTDEE